MEALTIISAMASIIGAYIAYDQASKAKSSADEAKRVRAQMVDHRQASELSNIQSSCKKALDSMKKYGPAFTPSRLAGINNNLTDSFDAQVFSQRDGTDVQDFIYLLKEHREYFGNKKPNEADEFCDVLTPLLENFSGALSPEDRKKYGKQIATNLSSISAAIKKRLDNKREKIR